MLLCAYGSSGTRTGSSKSRGAGLAAVGVPPTAPPGAGSRQWGIGLAAASAPLAALPGATARRHGRVQQLGYWEDRTLSGALVAFLRHGTLLDNTQLDPEVARGDRGWHNIEDVVDCLSLIHI